MVIQQSHVSLREKIREKAKKPLLTSEDPPKISYHLPFVKQNHGRLKASHFLPGILAMEWQKYPGRGGGGGGSTDVQ